MSAGEDDICLRLAQADDHPRLADFIDRHWKRGHVLARSRELMDWQHRDRETGGYHFVIASEARTAEILGLLGYIPTSQFDPALAESRDLWLVLWKVRADNPVAGLGLRLYWHLVDRLRPRSIGAVGLGRAVVPLYATLGFATGVLGHRYLVNPSRRAFSLLGRFDGRYHDPVSRPGDARLEACSVEGVEAVLSAPRSGALPTKTARYVAERYLHHPFYRYQAHTLSDGDGPRALLVTRTVAQGGAQALRIVDVLGDVEMLARGRGALQEILEARECEFADCYDGGIDEAVWREAGFLRVDTPDGVIVPNHFEPYEARNVEISYAVKSPSALPYRILRGDSDQDRPSLLA